MRKPRKNAAVTLVVALLAVIGFAVPITGAAPAEAATCTYKTLKYYPGSAISKVRYGQINVKFKLCGSNPDNWTASTSSWTNGTGDNLGIFIKRAEIDETSQTSGVKKWLFEGFLQSCTPRVGWPCAQSWGITIKYHVDKSRTGQPILWPGTPTVNAVGVAVFRTP
ncbi:hypothetical protein ACQEVY_17325 [Streptomyces sp. CA-288835]|uniref:hypothetical protein n=1 Tax=Streptomyces sp. CA-288835 TaxID=3240069 RepID=UPI003D89DCA9